MARLPDGGAARFRRTHSLALSHQKYLSRMSRWLSITSVAGGSVTHSPIGAGKVVVVDGRDGPFGLGRPGSGQDGENGALGR